MACAQWPRVLLRVAAQEKPDPLFALRRAMPALLLSLLFLAGAPAPAPLSMAVSTQKKILVVRIGGQDVKQYDVAVGTPKHATPMGRFGVRHIVWNPAWVPPKATWAKGTQRAPPNDPKSA